VLFGAMVGMISLLVFQLRRARVWFSMSRDGLLPRSFGRCEHRARGRHGSPALISIPAAFDIGTLADLSNIGTLFAFVLVSAGVIILRFREPERRRGFRAPGGLMAPVLSVIFCFLLMAGLPILTWVRFFGWLALGLIFYFAFSRRNSVLAGK
jgi:APA family basic amino acid/polyamine antiporter